MNNRLPLVNLHLYVKGNIKQKKIQICRKKSPEKSGKLGTLVIECAFMYLSSFFSPRKYSFDMLFIKTGYVILKNICANFVTRTW